MYIWRPGIWASLQPPDPKVHWVTVKFWHAQSLFLILYFILPTTGITYSERKTLTSWEFTTSPSSLRLKCCVIQRWHWNFNDVSRRGLWNYYQYIIITTWWKKKKDNLELNRRKCRNERKPCHLVFFQSIILLMRKPRRCVRKTSFLFLR